MLEQLFEGEVVADEEARAVLQAWTGAESFANLQVLQKLRDFVHLLTDLGLEAGTYAARYGRIDILEWLFQDDKFAPGPGCVYDPGATRANVFRTWMETAALEGNMPSINWLLNLGLPMHESACAAAAQGGHVGVLGAAPSTRVPVVCSRHGCSCLG